MIIGDSAQFRVILTLDLMRRQPQRKFLQLGTHRFTSRLIVGTGKYADYQIMGESLERSGTECITVAVRRERLIDAAGNNLLDFIDTSRYTLLPNTAGCFNADDAVRVARLGREILLGLENPGADWVKLEVLADKRTLLPDPIAHARSHRAARGRRFSGAVLHDRRSGHRAAAQAGGCHKRHAGRQPDRLRAGHSQSRTTFASAWSTSRKTTPTTR